MSNVKPGDLAMVVNVAPPWGGATCLVLAPCDSPDAEMSRRFGSLWWRIETPRPMPMWNPRDGTVQSTQGVCPDVLLRKIGGPDVSIDETAFNPLAHEQTA